MNVVVAVAKNQKGLEKMPNGIEQQADITVVSGQVTHSRLPGEMVGHKWKAVLKVLRANGHTVTINDPAFLNQAKRAAASFGQ